MSRRLGNPAVLVSLCFALSTATPEIARAWTPPTRISMAEWALRVTPPDLERQILRHKRRFRDGILAVGTEDAAAASSVDRTIRRQTERAIQAITEHRPFSEIVYQMGVVAGLVAAANSPLRSVSSGGSPPRYRLDYLQYLEDCSSRFAVLFYGHDRRIDHPRDLDALLRRTFERSQALAPMVAEEYVRIGSINGKALFDDRSTAFGVGALAFSHAVSDIAGVLRYVWLRAGGADTSGLPPLDEDHLILIGHGLQSP